MFCNRLLPALNVIALRAAPAVIHAGAPKTDGPLFSRLVVPLCPMIGKFEFRRIRIKELP